VEYKTTRRLIAAKWRGNLTTEEAVDFAEEVGYPLVMKIASPDILHKTDIGGVRLNISNTGDVRDSFDLLTAISAFNDSLDVPFFFNFCPFLLLLNTVSSWLVPYRRSLRIIFRLYLICLGPFCKGLFPLQHSFGGAHSKMALFLQQKHINYQ